MFIAVKNVVYEEMITTASSHTLSGLFSPFITAQLIKHIRRLDVEILPAEIE